jgi:hypothetical protein
MNRSVFVFETKFIVWEVVTGFLNIIRTNFEIQGVNIGQSQSQSYFTTGGLPPVSSSWQQAP